MSDQQTTEAMLKEITRNRDLLHELAGERRGGHQMTRATGQISGLGGLGDDSAAPVNTAVDATNPSTAQLHRRHLFIIVNRWVSGWVGGDHHPMWCMHHGIM
jgi:hypothetical protein